jgi:hypothetical protein
MRNMKPSLADDPKMILGPSKDDPSDKNYMRVFVRTVSFQINSSAITASTLTYEL